MGNKYVTVAGAGAGTGADWGNAWTLVQAASGATAGDTVYVEEGTYTLSGAVVLPNGAAENPIVWIGVKADHSSLMGVGRESATSALTTTNFPVIAGSGATNRLSGGTYSLLMCLRITNDAAGAALGFGDYGAVYRCSIANTYVTSNSGASGVAAASGSIGRYSLMDCDVSISTASTTAGAVSINTGSVYGCRIWHTNTLKYGVGVKGGGASVVSCLFLNLDAAISDASAVIGCSVYNCKTPISISSTLMTCVANNVIHGATGYNIGGSSAGCPLIINNASTAATSGQIDITNLGSVIQEFERVNSGALASNPFVDAVNGDFTLNDIASAGALCRRGSKLWDGGADLGAIQVPYPEVNESGVDWSTWVAMPINDGGDGVWTADNLADSATTTGDAIDLDLKASCEVSIAIGDPGGTVTGVITCYILRDIDGTNYEDTVNGSTFRWTITPVNGSTVRKTISVDPEYISKFKFAVKNTCGRQVALTVKYKTAVISAASGG